jgi:hypothetical protein
MKLTICFEAPFYVAIVEQVRDGKLYAARHVFGPEPSDAQVYAFVLADLAALCQEMRRGVPVDAPAPQKRVNPKRLQREIRREMEQAGRTRKAHDAMRQSYEAQNTERQQNKRARRRAERDRKYALKQKKARKKRRGH